ncbi:MAG: MATE family efflux transporter, partial [Lachnospiraceae bacterium]|nr:MATE family efflux transporter [Lachnospiraceae bacterium]
MDRNQEQFKKMTETPIPKLVMRLGLPTTVSMLVTSIYNLVDTYFVSEINNSASGAIGVVFALMGVIQAFGFMFGHGAGSNISRRLGARDVEKARIFASTSMFLGLFAGSMIL